MYKRVKQLTMLLGGRRGIPTLIVVALLIASNGVNLLLARRVTMLRALITSLKEEGRLKKGTRMEPLSGVTPEGRSAEVDFRGGTVPTVLYVFSPTCHWCEVNLKSLDALVNGIHGRYRIIGLSVSSTKLSEYIAANHLSFPVITDVPAAFLMKYHIGGTPQTIIVSQKGVVLHNWIGAYQGSQKSEIETTLGVKLPSIPSGRATS